VFAPMLAQSCCQTATNRFIIFCVYIDNHKSREM
jgi:hypothetical protein